MSNPSVPTIAQAEALLHWAQTQNPGRWIDHCRTAARAARCIAQACGLDADRAYVSGLLHDVGRYEGVRGLHHAIAGYQLLMDKGWEDVARVCLTHSFPLAELEAFAGPMDCTPEETAFIAAYLRDSTYNDYDRLIQLCDGICLPDRVTLMDTRLIDVAMRHGVTDIMVRKWRAFYAVKQHFDALCGGSVYALFREEIVQGIFDT